MDIPKGNPVIWNGRGLPFSEGLEPEEQPYEVFQAKIFAVYDELVWTDVDGPESGPGVVYGFKARIKVGKNEILHIVSFKDIEPLVYQE
tara:strand:+ start:141 stop:407 length:267 start_codon:yes stop_codon:yes gene_type:complete